MSKIKKLISLLVSLTLVISISVCSYAKNINQTTSIIVDGTQYTINETLNSAGDKVTTVTDNIETTKITNDGTYLYIEVSSNKTKSIEKQVIKIDYSVQPNNSQRTTGSGTSLFWNYGYYYNTSPSGSGNYGMFWSLDSGDTYGSWSGFDNNNQSARDLGYYFCSSVRSLDTTLGVATAASVVAGGSVATAIASAIASAGPTLGASGVIAIVASFISGGTAAAEWYNAYNKSKDCNEYFIRFQQAL